VGVEGATPEGSARWLVLDRPIRIAGLVIATVAALVTGLFELFTTTLRVGGVLIGVSIPLAIVLNVAIAWFVVTTTDRRWTVGPPWVAWSVLMLLASGFHKAEGDRLLSDDNWVAVLMTLLGSLAFAGYCYRMILKKPIVTKM
jgi:hypothetical protein